MNVLPIFEDAAPGTAAREAEPSGRSEEGGGVFFGSLGGAIGIVGFPRTAGVSGLPEVLGGKEVPE